MQNANVAADTPINTDAINDAGQDDGRTIDGVVVEVKAPDPAMAVLDPAGFAMILFQPFADELASTKRSAARTKYDATTPAGLAKAKEFLNTYVKIRNRAEDKKAEFKKPLDLAGKKILEHFHAIEDAARIEEKKHADVIEGEKRRKAAIAEEKQRVERARIEAIEARIAHIRGIPAKYARADSATLQVTIDDLLAKQLDPKLYDEHLEAAAQAMIETVEALRQLHADAITSEAQAAELARLRAADEQRKKEDEARAAAAAVIQRQQDEAAAKMRAQQAQMAAIIEVQGLATALTAAGKSGDRSALEAALTKARAFDPTQYGAMSPMAQLARDAALPLLEELLANLPAPIMETVQAPSPSPAAVELPVSAQMEVVRAAGDRWPSSGGVRRLPDARRPSDLDMLEVVANHFGVPSTVALSWLATFEAHAVRALLSEV